MAPGRFRWSWGPQWRRQGSRGCLEARPQGTDGSSEFPALLLDRGARATRPRALPFQVLVALIGKLGPYQAAFAGIAQSFAGLGPPFSRVARGRRNDDFPLVDADLNRIICLDAN